MTCYISLHVTGTPPVDTVNGDEEVCPEAGVKEEGQTVVVVVVVRNWLGSCVYYRIGSAGLTVLLCNLD